MRVPIMIWINKAEGDWIKQNLKDLARHGIVVAVSTPLYGYMKANDITRARAEIKPMTAHNDKLGFDFDVNQRAYVVKDPTKPALQFNTS